MASGSERQEWIGVVLGPLKADLKATVLATRVYTLMLYLGLKAEHIDKIWINTKHAYARVTFQEIPIEDNVVEACKNIKAINEKFNLLNLTNKIHDFKVARLRPSTIEYEGLDRFWRRVTENHSKHTFELTFNPLLDAGITELKHTQTIPKTPEKVDNSTKVTNSLISLPKECPIIKKEKPVLLSAKTSTAALVEPCFFPGRRYYLQSEIPQWPDKHVVFVPEDVYTTSSSSKTWDKVLSSFAHAAFSVASGRLIFLRGTVRSVFKRVRMLKYVRIFRQTLGKHVCASLNTEGGDILFGVSLSGQVTGFQSNQKSEDKLTLDIDYVMETMKPTVPVSAYHVCFARIINATGRVEPDRVVLHVKISCVSQDETIYDYLGSKYIWVDNKIERLHYITASHAQAPSTSAVSAPSDRGGHSQVKSGTPQQDNGGISGGNRDDNIDGNRDDNIDANRDDNIDGNRDDNIDGNRDDDIDGNIEGNRGGYRGGNIGGYRGENRGGYRGENRGGYREENRGGYRNDNRGGHSGGNRGGYREENRGGYRNDNRGGHSGENRGGYRGEHRGGYSGGNRGGYREENRGGYREENRGGYRDGNRGGHSGGNRGGYRDGNRGGYRDSYRGGHMDDYRGGYMDDYRGGYMDEYRGGYMDAGYMDAYGGGYMDAYGGGYMDAYGGGYMDAYGGGYMDNYRGGYRGSNRGGSGQSNRSSKFYNSKYFHSTKYGNK